MEAYLKKENGVCTMDKEFAFMCSLLRNGEYTVTIKRKTEPRSLKQKGLYWVWIKHIGACFAQENGELFYLTKAGHNWIHEKYANKYLPKIRFKDGDKVAYVPKSTEKLSMSEMHSYMEKIKIDIMSEHGIIVPLPEDRYYNTFVEQYKNLKTE